MGTTRHVCQRAQKGTCLRCAERMVKPCADCKPVCTGLLFTRLLCSRRAALRPSFVTLYSPSCKGVGRGPPLTESCGAQYFTLYVVRPPGFSTQSMWSILKPTLHFSMNLRPEIPISVSKTCCIWKTVRGQPRAETLRGPPWLGRAARKFCDLGDQNSPISCKDCGARAGRRLPEACATRA